MGEKRTSRWTLIGLGGLVAIISIGAWKIWSVKVARDDESSKRGWINAITSGIWNYRAFHRCMPPATVKGKDGTELASWRLAVFDWLEARRTVFPAIDSPWQSEKYDDFRSPSIFAFFSPDLTTRVAAVVGNDTLFDEAQRCQVFETVTPDYDTIVIIEVAGTGLNWMAPGDLKLQDFERDGTCRDVAWINNVPGNTFHVGFDDYKVWAISKDTPLRTLASLMTIKRTEQRGRQAVLGQYGKEVNW